MLEIDHIYNEDCLEGMKRIDDNSIDLVLDPFSGSASTAVACINQQRHFIGFEIDKECYDASIKRLNSVTPRLF